jgi:hypothetical protein
MEKDTQIDDVPLNLNTDCPQSECGACSSSGQVAQVLKQEENIRHKTDENGVRWLKVYFGGGAHYKNWLEQAEEIFGKENIMTEEVSALSLKCFGASEEKAFRVWVKENR